MAGAGTLDCPNCGAKIQDDASAAATCAFCGTSVAFPKRQKHVLEQERATLNEQVLAWEAKVLKARLYGSPILLRAGGCGCATYVFALIFGWGFYEGFRHVESLDAMQQQTVAGSAAVIALIVMLLYARRWKNRRAAHVAQTQQERDAALAPVRKRLAEIDMLLAE
ncbi:MAG: hypothetical protein JO197_21595 [Acidobacteria bacterium]|nr:hypothetical protein [Acidobacteriota bacterium]MBV9475484.1 hypothetical protein [Acidobacteriota bacterium]